MQQTIKWNGGCWTKEAVEREIASYQKYLASAKQEAAAGNERMTAYAEGYALRLDALLLIKAQFVGA